MELYDIAQNLFTYLSTFRLRVEAGAGPSVEELKKELLHIFHQQEILVRRNPALASGYNQARYPLVVFTDDVVLNSEWEHAVDWETELLERRFFNSEVGGDRFFELCDSVENGDSEVVCIYYICLTMGFRGRYEADSEDLRYIRESLRGKCVQIDESSETLLCPRAYDAAVTGVKKLPVILKWRHVAYAALILVGLYLFLDRVIIWNTIAAPLNDVSNRAATVLELGKLPAPDIIQKTRLAFYKERQTYPTGLTASNSSETLPYAGYKK